MTAELCRRIAVVEAEMAKLNIAELPRPREAKPTDDAMMIGFSPDGHTRPTTYHILDLANEDDDILRQYVREAVADHSPACTHYAISTCSQRMLYQGDCM